MLAFALGLSLPTAIIFGMVPAWFATRTDPAEALRGSGRVAGDRSSLARKALLIVQATLSVANLLEACQVVQKSLDTGNILQQYNGGRSSDGPRRIGAGTAQRPALGPAVHTPAVLSCWKIENRAVACLVA